MKVCCICYLAEAVAGEMTKYINDDSEWSQDGRDRVVTTENSTDLKDKLDNSAYDASGPADEGTSVWAENVASDEAGASGWSSNSFKNTDANTSQLKGTCDNARNTDRQSHWFTGSVVVNTGNKERCEFILN